MMKRREGLGLLLGCENEAHCFNTRKLTIETDWGFQVLAISQISNPEFPFPFILLSILQYPARLLAVKLESYKPDTLHFI